VGKIYQLVVWAPRQDVFNYVKILDNQRYFSKWVMMDPNLKIKMSGTDRTSTDKSIF
jgi:hypothetical protein